MKGAVLMDHKITALQHAIDGTLSAISDGRGQVQIIAEGIVDEVKMLEGQFEAVRQECVQAIDQVETLQLESIAARERLMIVNRHISKYSEADMKEAYDKAQTLQVQLGQWREREAQLRYRRDDIARRLKSLRVTAYHAEVLTLKLDHASDYLTVEFHEMASVLRLAETQTALGFQMIQMQEEERRSLSQRLHDGPMQSLASVAMRLQATQSPSSDSASQKDIRDRLNMVIGEIRQVVFDLRPPLLDDLGLVPTLKRYAQQWAETRLTTVRIHLVGLEATLSATEKVVIFRSVQEAFSNIANHAKAEDVDITLTYGSDRLVVHVDDNGQGIPETDWMKWVEDGKLGLTVCRQRLSILGGTLDVERIEPQGTKVTISLPFTRRSDE
jgi:two-component system, NarL family, sensor histidine kinase DegS